MSSASRNDFGERVVGDARDRRRFEPGAARVRRDFRGRPELRVVVRALRQEARERTPPPTTASAYALTLRLIVETTTTPPGRASAAQAATIDAGSGTCSSISMQVTMSKAPGISSASASAAMSRYSAVVPDSSLCRRATPERLVAEVDAERRCAARRHRFGQDAAAASDVDDALARRARRPSARSSRGAADSSCAAVRTSRFPDPTIDARASRTCRARRRRRCGALPVPPRDAAWRSHSFQSLLPKSRGGDDRRLVGGLQHAARDHPPARHPDVGDRLATHRVDEVGHGIVAGRRIRSRQVDRDRRPPPCPATSEPIRLVESERARAGQRRRAKRLLRAAARTDRRWPPWRAARQCAFRRKDRAGCSTRRRRCRAPR